jgi:hypothetical protein
MVHTLLEHLEMAACGPDRMLPEAEPEGGPVAVAVYNGEGTTNGHFLRLNTLLGRAGGITVRPLSPEGIRAGALEPFDTIIFPGGSASKQARALGEDGRRRVRAFVEAGGGYVGICAGAYLATCRYTWSLDILDAYVMDRKHWRRGTGVVEMEMTPAGRKLLGGRQGRMRIYYANGPLLAAAGRDDLPDLTPLAHYRSEVAEHGAPKGVMADTPAIATALFGEGRVIVFGPHPEKPRSEEGAEELILNATRFCARAPQPTGAAARQEQLAPVGQ